MATFGSTWRRGGAKRGVAVHLWRAAQSEVPVTGTGRPHKKLWVVPPDARAPLDHSTVLSGRLHPLVGTSQAGAATGAAAKAACDVNNQGSLGVFPVHACADAGRAACVPRVCASLPSLASHRAWSWSKAGQIEEKGPRWPLDWKSPTFVLYALKKLL
jgi:hypothetical protein